MKNLKYWILGLMAFFILPSCDDDDLEIKQAGNPTIEVKSQFANVHFGDELPFVVNVNDNVSLSTLTAKLFFGEEEVSSTVIRTKENGEYSGTISVPFNKGTPDGTATLTFVLLNTTMKSAKQTIDVPVTRAKYPYLILVTEDASYPMLPTGASNEYAATEAFPSTDLPAYIKTPVVDDKGTELVFGWESGAITEGVSSYIPFVSPVGGAYSVTFNTKTYEAAPFFEILFDGAAMNMLDKENYEIDKEMATGHTFTIEGIGDLANWWIDADFLKKEGDNEFSFVPMSGKYRFTANLAMKYIKIEALSGNSPASLQEDGTGAIWVIGESVGKPSVADNEVGWNTDKAICLAPMGNKKYQLTLVAGETVNANSINFKFFHQKDWGGEFGADAITTNSDIILIGDGTNGRDSGNLGLHSELEVGATYVFTVDLSAGNEQAVLTVTKK
ncbi:hypothetical protein M2459_002155 [Parabacteroides sp. PF5-5]|uniref:DUF5121 domain-containing protein n=1 Tax=unclassified Parabacteroides TaxID=2649774 RepID=UPI0024772617|nr:MULTISPECIES: DUF5125 domain-containing protein [unclassified Parabacteroides]MDH6306829.1 hypothetical protein [Parabacteroides sp. PH5-39]MDH6316274.1 hypothetical protein [Parabacteroides sp. PF5-13]MDH6319757.1 hypothetical protein [Parabacteroides sp. PH5-13]MDH6323651.1 hypothetical protein [Parabacteroides sp. PH5-8]MDH6327461.1 hypothetical protein [Parabacteroides sp. PH5-41]